MSTTGVTRARAVIGRLYVRSTARIIGNTTIDGSLAVGGGTAVKQTKSFAFTITPTANTIAANTVYETGNLTVTGAALGDSLVANPQALEAGLIWGVQVTGAGTVKVRIANPTLADVTTAARSWTVLWTDLT